MKIEGLVIPTRIHGGSAFLRIPAMVVRDLGIDHDTEFLFSADTGVDDDTPLQFVYTFKED